MVTDRQLANLRPIRSREEATEKGRAGGKKSGRLRALLKSFKEIDAETTTTKERKVMLEAVKLLAMKGNLRAFEVYRDTVGQKHPETLEVREELKNPYETLTTEQLLKLVAMGDDKEREEEQR